ncbi:penicillin-binding protein 2 [Pelosinus sp. IPA-1]|uniref:penicillin-binding protein 2 n=1 Tax=Pelosinus sp. IPA-1 TaxID=3029569 RepID=UPI0024361542|nr:penicillin-binding protein 2 [Pelosinus sp. IPA-1]GMA98568.1 penicillin-binding protein 2 [Pelosinus sp. IPA-1]
MWITEKSRRLNIMAWIVITVIALLILRLAWMQLLHGPQYKKFAEENHIHQITAQAPRGIMYDHNGALLVTNRPSFAISIIPAKYSKDWNTTLLLANIIDVQPDEIERLLKVGAEYPYTPIRVKRDVDAVLQAKIREREDELPGVIIEAMPIREYVYKELAAHVFGYLGSINEEEYVKRKEQGYKPTDFIGKDGLEQEWEEVLRGIDGGLQIEVNAAGEEIQIIGDKKAIAGKGLMLTIDINLQKAAQDALMEQIEEGQKRGEPTKGGSVVVLDVRTGAVRAMVSYPSFDPNQFASGISNFHWNELINNPYHPLTNKSIQNVYPPGSVFKIVTAAAALDMNYVTKDEIFDDKGVYILDGWKFFGWQTKGLGKLNIVDAIAWSSDPVFYELGRRMGVDSLASYALTFGLGKKSGIGLQGEEEGTVPTENWKKVTYDEQWYAGETVIAAIGQGYYLVTPLQQAMLLMAVANKGTVYRPMLVEKVLTADGAVAETYQPEILHTIYLRGETWDLLKQGLVAVTTKGTGLGVFQGMTPIVAGKSGSAETGTGTVHSWFACYAPAENPEIAVAVLVEEGGEGSVAAAPVVRKIVEAYFALKKK